MVWGLARVDSSIGAGLGQLIVQLQCALELQAYHATCGISLCIYYLQPGMQQLQGR
jgi:hypothetical protein